MDSSRFREIERLFQAVVEVSDEGRESLLRERCANDPELRAEVEGLLAHHDTDALEGPSELHDCVEQVLANTGGPAPAPERIGPYRILRRIGLGGMGVVYEAEQASPKRRVALKVIRHDFLSTDSLSRFRQEGELLGRLQHPGIAQILEAGTFDHGEGDQPFFAMEFVDGERLPDYVLRQGLSVQERLRLFADVCDAMQHAHQQGVIHRDLKPDNILVTSDGQPKVLDFGVAYGVSGDVATRTVLTRTGAIVGTLRYMSPEQLESLPGAVDPGSDVYSLGVILFELLTGRVPFGLREKSLLEAARIIREQDPPPLGQIRPELRGDLELIVGMALVKEPERRYIDAGDLASDVRRFLNHVPVQARPATAWYQVRKFTQRHRTGVVGAVATVLVLIGGIVSTSVQALRASRNARVALAGKAAAERSAYHASIAAASAGALLGDVEMGRRQLGGVPVEWRQWEWRYLNAQFDQTESIHALVDDSRSAFAMRARIAFRDDGRPLVAELDGRLIQVRDVESGEELFSSELDQAPLRVALSPSGTLLAIVGPDHTLRVLAIASKQTHFETRLPTSDSLVDLAFNRDGSALMVGATHGLFVFDLGEGRVVAEHQIQAPLQYQAARFAGPKGNVTLIVGVFVPALAGWEGVEARLIDGRSGGLLLREPISANGVVACSGDGKFTLVGNTKNSNTPLILNGETLEAIGFCQGNRSVSCASFSPDGQLLAVGSPGRLAFSDTATLTVQRVVYLPGLEPEAVQWSPDGERLLVMDAISGALLVAWRQAKKIDEISYGYDTAFPLRDVSLAFHAARAQTLDVGSDELRVVDAETGEQVSVIETPTPSHAATLSPDRRWVAAIDEERSLRLWNADTGRLQSTGQLHLEMPLLAFRFSDDGTTIEASSAHELVLWDVHGGSVRLRYRIAPPYKYREAAYDRGASSLVLSVALRPDGAEFSEDTRYGRLLRIDGSTGETLVARDLQDVASVAMNGDGTVVISTSNTSPYQLQVLDGETLDLRETIGGHSLPSTSVAFSADGTLLASSSPERIVIHNAMTWEEESQISVPQLDPDALRWNPQGTRVAAGENGKELRVVRPGGLPYLEFLGHNSFVYVAAWSPDGQLIASADWDQRVCLWDAMTGALLDSWSCPQFVSMVGFSSDGSRLVAWSGGTKAWDIATGLLAEEGPPGDWLLDARTGKFPPGSKLVTRPSGGHTVMLSTDASRLLYVHDSVGKSGEDGAPLVLLNLAAGTERILLRDRHSAIKAVSISHDNRRIAVGNRDGTILILNADTGALEGVLDDRTVTPRQRDAYEGDVHCMEFSEDGQRLISGSDNARVVLWDLESGTEVMALEAHESYVHAVAYSPDGTRILSASGDGTLRVWDTVPLLDRRRQILRAESMRAEQRPRVEQLLDALADPAKVDRRLRSDASLTPEQLLAAQRCLLDCRQLPR